MNASMMRPPFSGPQSDTTGGGAATESVRYPNGSVTQMYWRIWAALILLPTIAAVAAEDASGDRISAPGRYVGYSQPIYAEDYAISSQYVAMRDGAKMAIDIYRPKDRTTGAVVETPLPVLWMHTPYNRRYNGSSNERLTVDTYAGTASQLNK